MPTLPLYTPNPVADASHRVAAPGGYEWWYFDAEGAEGDVQLVAIFLHGFVFHPGYLRQYFRYRRRPTKVPPPLPDQFPCVYFVVYEHGDVVAQFMSQVAPQEFSASDTEPAVRVGASEMRRGGDGSLTLTLSGVPWELTWQGPVWEPGSALQADLAFRPVLRHPPHERVFLSRALSSAEHHWVIANPLCDVEGRIRLTSNGRTREIQFAGRGYHDHNYGTAPIGPGLKQWVWGRAMFKDVVYTFHLARPSDPALPDEVHLLRCDADGVREVAGVQPAVNWSGRSPLFLPYPTEIAFGTDLRLTNARRVDSSPFYMRLIYEAVADGQAPSTAFCEVAYPHRLRWPVLGRMIEMSIHRADATAGNGQPPVL